MTFEEEARRVVTRIDPSAEVIDVKTGTQAATVSTSTRSWVVRDVTGQFEGEPSFRLYNVSGTEVMDPPRTPEGVAVSSDDQLFHVNEPDDLRRFWQAAGRELGPLGLAVLLSTYQSEAPAHETLVRNARELDEETTSHHSIPPDIAKAGPLMMTFITQYFTEEPPDYVERRHLVEWAVREDDDGQLDWFWTPIRLRDVTSG